MSRLFLNIMSADGQHSHEFSGERLTLGRGDVELRLADEKLSRRHAEIWREGTSFYIADVGSLNGTLHNEVPLSSIGKRLKDGDSIKLGDVEISVSIVENVVTSTSEVISEKPPIEPPNSDDSFTYTDSDKISLTAIIVSACAVLLIFSAAGAVVWKSQKTPDVAQIEELNDVENFDDQEEEKPRPAKTKTPENVPTDLPKSSAVVKTEEIPATVSETPSASINQPISKTYSAMSDDEKQKFVEQSAEKIARIISSRGGDAITPEAVTKIKQFVDQYARRLNYPKLGGTCNFTRDDLETLLLRAGKNAPFIIRAFNDEALAPQIGLYIAMIESEHCVCLQSPTKPLGMFQFTRATGQNFGLQVRAGASPSNPDERCQPEPAAKAAARYMRFLQGRYGTGPMSVPLGIASYNSGEGGLSKNLETALQEAAGQERSFWTLILRADALSDQFRKENKNYVPKFFAAAIVGENPSVFSVKSPPLSSISN